MPSPRRLLALSLPLLLLFSVSGCRKTADDSADPGSADDSGGVASTEESVTSRASVSLPIVAEVAIQGDLVLRVNTKGAVYGDAVVSLTSQVSGTVTGLLVRPGSRVIKGQPLLKLDTYPFDLAVRTAEATLREREQAYRESFAPESLVTGIGPTPEQRVALRTRSGVVSAELGLERAKWEMSHATVLAPMNGTVDRVDVSVGERLNAGGNICTIVDLSALRIEAQVLEHDLPLVRIGGEAMVTSAAVPGKTMRGRIEAVLPMVDSVTRVGRVLVRVPGESALRPGMYADVQLEAQRLPDRIMVPAKAVIQRDGRPLVFVVRDGRAQWTYILPGRSNGIDTEVLPDTTTGIIPIEPGDQIIVDGHLTLTHDAAVTVATLREREAPTPRRVPAARREND